MKSTGLGKGLSALFGSEPEEFEESTQEENFKELNILEVEPNRNQPRKQFDEDSLLELADSIRQYGVIQPIVVVKKNDYYEIIAGERRWRAAKLADLETIPAIIKEDDEKKNKEITLIENIQREDLNPLEKAIGIKQLMTDYELTQQQVSEILGKSRSGVANIVRLLNLDDRVKELILEGKITEGHAKVLLTETDGDRQYKMAISIIESEGSVRDLERKINNKKIVEKKRDPRMEIIFKDIETSFKNFFGAKVKLNAGARKGKIVIEYTSNEDLERIMGLIKS